MRACLRSATGRTRHLLFDIDGCGRLSSDDTIDYIKSKKPQENLFKLNQFLAPFVSIPFYSECSVAYTAIRSRLEKEGKRIGQNDTLIAATAIAHGATLISGNIREFSRVPNLEVENWREIDL